MSGKFKVGDKVLPISKSIGVDLNHSYAWKDSKYNGYMHIVEVNPELILYTNITEVTIYTCNSEIDDMGDYFLESDLIKYEEGY